MPKGIEPANPLVKYPDCPKRAKVNARMRAYREKNREACRAKVEAWNKSDHGKRMKWIWHLNKYRITPEIYDAKLLSQGGKCPICETTEPGRKGWHIDHCHTTGRFRGLLCLKCNLGIGYLNDNKTQLENAITYLSTS